MKSFIRVVFLQFALLSKLVSVEAFSSSPSNNFFSAFTDLFENKSAVDALKQSALVAEREELKSKLVNLCNDDLVKGTEKRKNVEELISKLRGVTPIIETATSPSLQKEWLLLWTTEKEINFFIDWNISGQITQTIDDRVLENNIPFLKGGSFGVKGKLSIPEDDVDETTDSTSEGVRTEFEFETASLDLGKWGKFSFPPVGKGWFDTVYLDENFRIDINSRDDILICKAD